MSVSFNIAAFIGSMALLWLGSGLAVKGLSKLAVRLNVSQFIVSFVIFGFASTFPEFFISMKSAIDKVPEIGIGTLIGSNLIDLTLILGVLAIVGKEIRIVHKVVRLDIWYVLLASMPVLLIIDGLLSRIDAVILLVVFSTYVLNLWKESSNIANVKVTGTLGGMVSSFLIVSAGVLVLFFSSEMVVKYAELLVIDLSLSGAFIGLVLVAFSTTMPEFSFAMRALHENKSEMAIGDIFGNVIIDATFIPALVALIRPVTFQTSSTLIGGAFMIFSALVALYFIEAEKKLTWKSGLVLFFIYYVFLSIEAGINILAFG